MINILKGIAVALLLFASTAYAREIAVLLPIAGSLTPFEKSEISKVVVEGLSAKFELKYGEGVDHFVKQAFQDESKKNDCDETNCYRRIASKFHAQSIVALRVIDIDKGRYLVTTHLYDVATGEMTSSQNEECAQCSFEKLKVLFKELIARMSKAQ
jgi:hypothetical protein